MSLVKSAFSFGFSIKFTFNLVTVHCGCIVLKFNLKLSENKSHTGNVANNNFPFSVYLVLWEKSLFQTESFFFHPNWINSFISLIEIFITVEFLKLENRLPLYGVTRKRFHFMFQTIQTTFKYKIIMELIQ